MAVQIKMLVLCLSIAGCQASSFGKIAEEHTVDGSFPAMWMDQLNYAYRDYMKSNSDPACLQLKTYDEDGKRFLSIYPRIDIEKMRRTRTLPIHPKSPCGKVTNYQFDKSGKFIRKTFER